MMRKIKWPAILIAFTWVMIVAIVFGYGVLGHYLEGDWLTIITWLVMPILLMSIIICAGDHRAS
jgi:hypothetical protein